MTQTPPSPWRTTITLGPAQPLATGAPNPRMLFEQCPLCDSKEFRALRTADCSKHPLYHPTISPTMTWMRCETCAHVFTDGYFSPETNAVLFARANEHQQLGADMEQQRDISALIVDRVASYVTGGDWLDIGFGHGALLFTAQEWGFVPVGIDLRQANVDALAGYGIEAHCVDVTQWEQPGRFSVVSLADVLEHMPDPKRALSAAKRLLRDDGILFLSMPSYDCALWRKFDADAANPYWGELEHFHNFSRARLYGLLAHMGFAPLRYNVSNRYRLGMEIIARSMA